MQRARQGSPLAWAATALLCAVCALAACAPETRYRVASTFFDGVPAPQAQGAVGREAQEAPPPPQQTTPAVSTPADVPEPAQRPRPRREPPDTIRARLPNDPTGKIDWVSAAGNELIQPLASPDGSIDPMPPLRLDIQLDPGLPGFNAVFPHEPHTFWLRCDNCHPQIFTMKAGANPITMGAIFQGEYCGRCHGKVAFAPATNCSRCHVNFGAGG